MTQTFIYTHNKKVKFH